MIALLNSLQGVTGDKFVILMLSIAAIAALGIALFKRVFRKKKRRLNREELHLRTIMFQQRKSHELDNRRF